MRRHVLKFLFVFGCCIFQVHAKQECSGATGNAVAASPKHSRIVDAITVAMSNYETILKKERERLDWKYADYVADIKNYNIGASETDGLYIIVFTLRSDNLSGGDATYYVGKDNLDVVKLTRGK